MEVISHSLIQMPTKNLEIAVFTPIVPEAVLRSRETSCSYPNYRVKEWIEYARPTMPAPDYERSLGLGWSVSGIELYSNDKAELPPINLPNAMQLLGMLTVENTDIILSLIATGATDVPHFDSTNSDSGIIILHPERGFIHPQHSKDYAKLDPNRVAIHESYTEKIFYNAGSYRIGWQITQA